MLPVLQCWEATTGACVPGEATDRSGKERRGGGNYRGEGKESVEEEACGESEVAEGNALIF